jgi:antitoxin StbD
MMTQTLASPATATLEELAKNPLETFATGQGLPVAILDKEGIAFYCVSPKSYEDLVAFLKDAVEFLKDLPTKNPE